MRGDPGRVARLCPGNTMARTARQRAFMSEIGAAGPSTEALLHFQRLRPRADLTFACGAGEFSTSKSSSLKSSDMLSSPPSLSLHGAIAAELDNGSMLTWAACATLGLCHPHCKRRGSIVSAAPTRSLVWCRGSGPAERPGPGPKSPASQPHNEIKTIACCSKRSGSALTAQSGAVAVTVRRRLACLAAGHRARTSPTAAALCCTPLRQPLRRFLGPVHSGALCSTVNHSVQQLRPPQGRTACVGRAWHRPG